MRFLAVSVGSIFGAALANVETFKLEYWTQGRNAGHPGH